MVLTVRHALHRSGDTARDPCKLQWQDANDHRHFFLNFVHNTVYLMRISRLTQREATIDTAVSSTNYEFSQFMTYHFRFYFTCKHIFTVMYYR